MKETDVLDEARFYQPIKRVFYKPPTFQAFPPVVTKRDVIISILHAVAFLAAAGVLGWLVK